MFLHRINFVFKPTGQDALKVLRRQIPVRVQYASTVHSSQGRTLDRIVLDVRTLHAAFVHGMTYTGLSRVRRPGDCTLLVDEDQIHRQTGCIRVKNVVYRSFFD